MVASLTPTLVPMSRLTPSTFGGLRDTFLTNLLTWAPSANTLADELNANSTLSSANVAPLIAVSNMQKAWIAQAYLINKSVTHLNKIWYSNTATLSTDVPGVSTKWTLLTRDTGFKNFVINGNFVSWQRGTSGFTATGYAADQWRLNNITTGACVCERVTKSDGRYGIRFDRGTCSTASQNLEQRIELPQYLAGCVVNLSFKIKFLVASPSFAVSVKWVNGSTVSPSVAQLNLSDTTNEQTYTLSFVLPSDASDYSYLKLLFYGNGATGTTEYDFELSQVQLEEGIGATGFEARPKELEIAMCQRYYYRLTAATGATLGVGFHVSTTTSRIVIPFPVSMRAVPTALLQSGVVTDYSVMQAAVATACSAVPTFLAATTEGAVIVLTVAAGLTAGDGTYGRANAAATWLAWSAEL